MFLFPAGLWALFSQFSTVVDSDPFPNTSEEFPRAVANAKPVRDALPDAL